MNISFQFIPFEKTSKTLTIAIRRSTIVGQRPMKLLSSVCTSVWPSARHLLSFLKIESLVFFDFVHHDGWSWYLVTGKTKFLIKKIWRPEIGAKELKSGPVIWNKFLDLL